MSGAGETARHPGLARSLAVAMGVAALAEAWAGAQLFGLYGDGAYCLRQILSRRGPGCIEAPRRALQILLETPTVAAVRLGVTDLDGLAAAFSLSLQLAPLILTALAMVAIRPPWQLLRLLPAFAYFAGSSTIMSNGIIEGPTATAYFWLLLALMLCRSDRPGCRLLMGLAALPAIFSHEVMTLLAPVLSLAAFISATGRTRDDGRWFMATLGVWFLVVAGVQFGFVLAPRDATNRDGFIAQMLAFKWLYATGFGLNAPALLGLLAIISGATITSVPGRSRPVVAAFALATLVLTISVLLTPWGRMPIMQFFARNQPAFASVPLSLVMVGAWRWRWDARLPGAGVVQPMCKVLLLLAVATSTLQISTVLDWSAYTADLRQALRDGRGVIAWEAMTATLPPAAAARFARMGWGWTYPDLSILLSEGGQVRGIIANPAGTVWQPWDPYRASTYPLGAAWRYSLGRSR